MPLLLTRKDVQQVLTMADAINAVETGIRELALDHVAMPQRTAIRLTNPPGIHLGMPAHIGGDVPALALKVELLPAPFEPMRVIVSPSFTLMETPFSAVTPS